MDKDKRKNPRRRRTTRLSHTCLFSFFRSKVQTNDCVTMRLLKILVKIRSSSAHIMIVLFQTLILFLSLGFPKKNTSLEREKKISWFAPSNFFLCQTKQTKHSHHIIIIMFAHTHITIINRLIADSINKQKKSNKKPNGVLCARV